MSKKVENGLLFIWIVSVVATLGPYTFLKFVTMNLVKCVGFSVFSCIQLSL